MDKLIKNLAIAVGGFVTGALVTKLLTKEDNVFEYCYEDLSKDELEELYSDIEESGYEVKLTSEEVDKLFKPNWDDCDCKESNCEVCAEKYQLEQLLEAEAKEENSESEVDTELEEFETKINNALKELEDIHNMEEEFLEKNINKKTKR